MGKILTIDCQYVMPQVACAYLIVDRSRAIFVENNTSHAVPLLIEALKREGMSPEAVDYAIITHVHLDHAGGSGLLLQYCPNAILLCHPKAAKHVMDPGRLIASARQVYGESFDSLYGEILPVPESRIRIPQDGEEISWQSRKFQFLYTRGHANHHFCIYDSGSNGIFTGDSFGIAYPALSEDQSFIFPTTTPTDFDPEEALSSLEKILETGADTAYLTHFGGVGDLKSRKKDLEEALLYFWSLCKEVESSDILNENLQGFFEERIRSYLYQAAESKGVVLDPTKKKILEFDVILNAQGLTYYVLRSRKRSLS